MRSDHETGGPKLERVYVKRVQGQTSSPTATFENTDKYLPLTTVIIYSNIVSNPKSNSNPYFDILLCHLIYTDLDQGESLKLACYRCTRKSLYPTVAVPVWLLTTLTNRDQLGTCDFYSSKSLLLTSSVSTQECTPCILTHGFPYKQRLDWFSENFWCK